MNDYIRMKYKNYSIITLIVAIVTFIMLLIGRIRFILNLNYFSFIRIINFLFHSFIDAFFIIAFIIVMILCALKLFTDTDIFNIKNKNLFILGFILTSIMFGDSIKTLLSINYDYILKSFLNSINFFISLIGIIGVIIELIIFITYINDYMRIKEQLINHKYLKINDNKDENY